MTVFVGLDLAWTGHHESGVCVIADTDEGPRLVLCDALVATPRDFAEWIDGFGDDVVVAVDAPLVVREGRWAERALGRVFGGTFEAGAYTASPRFLARSGFAGPLLAAELAARGVTLGPYALRAEATGRHAFEMYPHAAHIVRFNLERTLKYKKGPIAARRLALAEYQRRLAAEVRPYALVAADDRLAALLGEEATRAAGRALKHLEDQLDALTCALVAYHCWREGPAGFAVFGCPGHGHIVTPGLPKGAVMPAGTCATYVRERPCP